MLSDFAVHQQIVELQANMSVVGSCRTSQESPYRWLLAAFPGMDGIPILSFSSFKSTAGQLVGILRLLISFPLITLQALFSCPA